MIRPHVNRMFTAILSSVIVMAVFSCSHEVKTYDEIRDEGNIERIVRKKYSRFFKDISRLAQYRPDSGAQDSALVSEASKAADEVMTDIREYPATLDSRLAYDAFSYAAHDLTVSEGFSQQPVSWFWEQGLVNPLVVKGWQYLKSEKPNDSTHLQLVRSISHAIYDKTTNDMAADLIPIVGPTPSKAVMAFCSQDSLVFRKIHDMLIYTRSLQKIGPPIWMVTGPWLLCFDIEGFPLSFIGLETVLVDKSLFLLFRTYDQATIYSTVYDDPPPAESDKVNSWLARAGAVMNKLTVDEDFVNRVARVELPLYDVHYFYEDYLVMADYDSTAVEYTLVFKRNRVENSTFSFVGADSLAAVFNQDLIVQFPEGYAEIPAKRLRGAAMEGGRYLSPKSGEGVAYLMPFGMHDDSILRKWREENLPHITVSPEIINVP